METFTDCAAAVGFNFRAEVTLVGGSLDLIDLDCNEWSHSYPPVSDTILDHVHLVLQLRSGGDCNKLCCQNLLACSTSSFPTFLTTAALSAIVLSHHDVFLIP